MRAWTEKIEWTKFRGILSQSEVIEKMEKTMKRPPEEISTAEKFIQLNQTHYSTTPAMMKA